ncbi:MAG: hypothetical protein COX34_01400 [Candidatus Nealsonbacteria bacterium CG23_combo_of_CG06-09_8_20_14_all_36_12]|uniref:Methyltransferase type 11 domain-containing protein n=2 Tax=Candidatus Nealsoniibacteriota TaxID=1817911 RepID=A0A2H0TNB7_9BACT|nr:MAG: hypothetical protein COX34_01400 [Candidatus Nealsonbacteria bacterium CG23_combo_of_CG06-09_8_20_14_all_36_12]PIR73046.1 MAG: hypothetical protein COV26_00625 [Candidatus Nealsonbacteria bacterium CG10_big_fil_rev_8_21_14_0_10_36_23]
MDRKYAEYLLEKTRQDYNLIAREFSNKREEIWGETRFLFDDYLIFGEKVLDLGCGNGRYFPLFEEKEVDYFGIDNSAELIKIAKEKYPQAKFHIANALNLPFPNNYFDKVYSIAVFHHMPSEEFRIRFLKEVKRVLKPGGLLIILVWNLWRRDILWKMIKYTILKILGKSTLDFKDIFYPWRKICQRYLHCFTKRELKNLVEEVGFKIQELGTTKGTSRYHTNIFLIARK